LKEQLRSQIKNRGIMYYYFFDEMRKVIGEEEATVIMKRAIYRRGLDVGKPLAKYGPDDLEGLRDAFLSQIVPGEDSMFDPEVLRCDEDTLEIKLRKCPLKEAYSEAGLSDDDKSRMLNIASQVDYGTFEAAGFQFAAESWRPGKSGCCHLQIRRGEKK